MQNTKSAKVLQIISGILLIMAGTMVSLYSFFHDFKYMADMLVGDQPFAPVLFTEIIEYFIVILLGIFIIIKKNSIPVTVCFGAMIAVELYWFINNFSLFTSYEPIFLITPARQIVSAVLLTVMAIFSLISVINIRCKALKLSFIPGILYFLIPLMYTCFRIGCMHLPGMDVSFSSFFSSFIYSSYFELVALAILLYGIALPRNKERSPQTPPVMPAPPMAENIADDVTAELRKYKVMLDEGLITEEDYNQKKSSLLQ